MAMVRPVVLIVMLVAAPLHVWAQDGQPRFPAAPSRSPAPLTVGAAVAEAIAASPAVRAQRTRADGEQAAAPWAGRLPNPSINWLGEGLRTNPPTLLQPDHGVFVVQSLPLGGRLGAERRLAEAEAGSASRDVDRMSEAVAVETVNRFLAAARARQLVAVLETQREGLVELVRIQQRRVDEGVAPIGDLGRLQAELARVEVQAARQGLESRRAQVALCMLLARADCDGWTPLLPDAAWLAGPDGVASLPADPAGTATVVDGRPHVQAALARQEAARFAKTLADASVWPSLDVTGGYKRTQFLDTGMVGLSISVPLFDRQRASRARATAAADAAAFEVDVARRDARLTITETLAQAAALARQVDAVDLASPALTAQRAARSAFREGATDLVRLLDAERLVADARTDELHLRLDALHAALQARVLLGLPLP